MEFSQLLDYCAQNRADVQTDSRKIKSAGIFVAVSGENEDGVKYIPQAIKNGADFIVCQKGLPIEAYGSGARFVFHEDPRQAVWRLAQKRWGTESGKCRIIGITGTNGKTTSACLLEHLFQSMGHKTGVLGTISYRWPGYSTPAPLTTPDALELHKMLASMEKVGVEYLIMEVSSHALLQQRVNGLNFNGVIFTNLTQDHLDFHKTMENYFRAKAKLFFDLPLADKKAAINGDDEYGLRLLESLPDAFSFGLHESARSRKHLMAEILATTTRGTRFVMRLGDQSLEMTTPLVGEFNVYNILGVGALAAQMGMELGQLKILQDFHGVCGRLERIRNEKDYNIFVDYAHTPDALVKAMLALRNAGFKKIVTVFGCGGNRDKTKRPLMGEAVARYADVAVVTSDNPRFERPEDIIADILPGLSQAKKVFVEKDRRKATAMAIDLLSPEDALLIAGKGHEDYQIIRGQKHHYSDQETVREILCG